MASNKDRLVELYAQLAEGDGAGWVAALADDVICRVHGPAPHAGETLGKAALLELMGAIMSTRQGETFAADTFVGDGDEVVILGSETWTYIPTGRSTEARFAHHYSFRDGQIALFEDFEPAGGDVY